MGKTTTPSEPDEIQWPILDDKEQKSLKSMSRMETVIKTNYSVVESK